MKKEMVARELVVIAKLLVSAKKDDKPAESDVEDEAFTQKLRDLRSALLTLGKKKTHRLSEYGIGALRPNNKVVDLVDALLKAAAAQ